MAITLSSVQSGLFATGTQLARQVTVSASTQFMIVSLSAIRGGSLTTLFPSDVDFNGDSFTNVGGFSTAETGVYVWYLINPDVGTYTLTANYSFPSEIRADVSLFTGVHQTTPTGASDSDRNTSSSTAAISTEITGLYTNSWSYNVSDAGVLTANPNVSIGSGETSRWDYAYSSGSQNHDLNGTTRVNTGSSLTAERTFGNACQSSLYSLELRSADGAAQISFDESLKLTSSINKQTNKLFLTNTRLISSINYITGTALNFSTNIILASTFAKKAFLNLSSNLKLTSSLTKLSSKILTSNVKLTSSISKLRVTLVNFISNLSLSSTIRIIKDGIRVGVWEKVVKTTSDWTKQAKSTSIWNKQDKDL